MLARLEAEVGVNKAEVDRHGELLRIALAPTAEIGPVIARLQELGFIGEIVPEGTTPQRWYGRNSVGELSAEEAGVIARRVVPKFAREHGLAGRVEVELISVVTAALHQCFVTNVLDVSAPTHSLDESCGSAAEVATQSQLGEAHAAALGRAIEADLAGRRG
ncbi:MAG: hypothetical protein AABM32_07085 [Chloroflexota bacterium]